MLGFRLSPAVPFGVPLWDHEERAAAQAVIEAGQVIDGEWIEGVEARVADLAGVPLALALRSGREAIRLALEAMGLGAGDEVVVPTFICGCVVAAVDSTGCVPVFADIDADLNLDPADLERRITDRTRAVIVAHMGGKLAAMSPILDTARAHDLFVIEDAAPAFGVRYGDGTLAGARGDVGVYSFGSGKSVMASAGGMLVCRSEAAVRALRGVHLSSEDDTAAAARVRRLLNRYRYRRYTWLPGLAMRLARRGVGTLRGLVRQPRPIPFPRPHRMANIDAALLAVQLDKAPRILERRRANAAVLARRLAAVEGLAAPAPVPDHGFTKFTVAVSEPGTQPGPLERARRLRALQLALFRRGVETEWSHIPLHLRPGFEAVRRADLPVAEGVWPRLINLPVGPTLGEGHMARVAGAVAAAMARQ